MDGHIEEHTAADCRILCRRGSGIPRGDFDDVDVADLAVGDHSSDVCKVVVKAAVEADLQLDARLLDGGDNCVDLLGGQVNGLLAEDVFACLGSLDSDIGVRVGRGADEHCFDVGVGEHLLIVS